MKTKIVRFIKSILLFLINKIKQYGGYCPIHGWFLYPKKYRMNTAYVDDKMNYAIGCKYCQKDSYEYYAELWADYYGSRL